MFVRLYLYAHVYEFRLQLSEVSLADRVGLALLCWSFDWSSKQLKDAWRNGIKVKGVINCLVDLMLYEHNLSSSLPFTLPRLPILHCFTMNLANAYSLNPCGLKTIGLCIWMGLYNKPMVLRPFEKDVKLFVGKGLESCKAGIQCSVSLYAYFTWWQSGDDLGRHGRPVDRRRAAQRCVSLQLCALKADTCCDLLLTV